MKKSNPFLDNTIHKYRNIFPIFFSQKLRSLIIDKVKPEFLNTLSKGHIEKGNVFSLLNGHRFPKCSGLILLIVTTSLIQRFL